MLGSFFAQYLFQEAVDDLIWTLWDHNKRHFETLIRIFFTDTSIFKLKFENRLRALHLR